MTQTMENFGDLKYSLIYCLPKIFHSFQLKLDKEIDKITKDPEESQGPRSGIQGIGHSLNVVVLKLKEKR